MFMSPLAKDRDKVVNGVFDCSLSYDRFRERSVAIWSFFNLTLIRAFTGVN